MHETDEANIVNDHALLVAEQRTDRQTDRYTAALPRRCVPFARLRSRPPSSSMMSAALTVSWPKMDGARDAASCCSTSGSAASCLMFWMSPDGGAIGKMEWQPMFAGEGMGALRTTRAWVQGLYLGKTGAPLDTGRWIEVMGNTGMGAGTLGKTAAPLDTGRWIEVMDDTGTGAGTLGKTGAPLDTGRWIEVMDGRATT
jgi:hypothetical protein